MSTKSPFVQSPLSGIHFVTQACIHLQQTERFADNTNSFIKTEVNPLANTIYWSIKRKSGRGHALRIQHIYAPMALTYVESEGVLINLESDIFALKSPQEAADLITMKLQEVAGER